MNQNVSLRIKAQNAKGQSIGHVTVNLGRPAEGPAPPSRALPWGSAKVALHVQPDGATLSVDGQPVQVDSGAARALLAAIPVKAGEVAFALRACLKACGKDGSLTVTLAAPEQEQAEPIPA